MNSVHVGKISRWLETAGSHGWLLKTKHRVFRITFCAQISRAGDSFSFFLHIPHRGFQNL